MKRDPIADLMITYISNEERRNTMSKLVQTYSRKPKHVEAIQLNDYNFEEVALWCGGQVNDLRESSDAAPIFELVVPNVTGNDRAGVGNFITRDLSDGRFWVKNANFFLEEYELPAEVRVDLNATPEGFEFRRDDRDDAHDEGRLPIRPQPQPAYLGIPGAVPVKNVVNVEENFTPKIEPMTPHYVPRMGRYDRG